MRPLPDGLRVIMPRRMLRGLKSNRIVKDADKVSRLANKLFLKVADLAAIAGDYYKSTEQYEKVAKSSIDNNLMKWSVKDYLLKAGICHLAANVSLHYFKLPFVAVGLTVSFF